MAESIKVGAVVSLERTATYYDGRIMPAWVKDKEWIVREVHGDRIIIDKSTDGKNAICSPVHVKNVVKA